MPVGSFVTQKTPDDGAGLPGNKVLLRTLHPNKHRGTLRTYNVPVKHEEGASTFL